MGRNKKDSTLIREKLLGGIWGSNKSKIVVPSQGGQFYRRAFRFVSNRIEPYLKVFLSSVFPEFGNLTIMDEKQFDSTLNYSSPKDHWAVEDLLRYADMSK